MYRVYLEINGDRELLGSFLSLEEAELFAEHAADSEQEYVYVKDSLNNVVFVANEPAEGIIYDEW